MSENDEVFIDVAIQTGQATGHGIADSLQRAVHMATAELHDLHIARSASFDLAMCADSMHDGAIATSGPVACAIQRTFTANMGIG